MTYFDGSDLVYFLPRFISQFLDEVEAGVDSFSHPTDSLFMHLTGWRRRNYEGIPFTAEQRELVEDVYALGGTFPDLQQTIKVS